MPKKGTSIRKVVFYTTASAGAFYVGSAFFAFNNQPYYDFFVNNVPLGSSFIQFAEEHDWDEITSDHVIDAGAKAVDSVQALVNRFTSSTADAKDTVSEKAQAAKDTSITKAQSVKETTISKAQSAKDATVSKAHSTKEAAVEKAQSVKAAAAEVYEHSKERVKAAASTLMTQVEKTEGKIEAVGKDSAASVKHQFNQFSSEVQDLVDQAEHVLAGKPISDLQDHTPAPAQAKVPAPATASKVYDAPLPLGHEPPPGFSKPVPAKAKSAPSPAPEVASAPPPLPLVAPAVSELSASEPVIAQLASTIDGLASFLNANPSAADKARDILDTAKIDLTAFAGRIEKVKAEERARLESELDAQAHEYNTKLLSLEMEAQDKLDSQEEGFRKYLDEEKAKFVKAYREKLDHELQTQSEIINERSVFRRISRLRVLIPI